MADTIINVADLITQYGAYYLGAENQRNLFNNLYRGISEIEKGIFRLVPIMGTRWESSDSILGDVLQAYQKAFTPNSQLDFIPNPIDLFKVKAELNVCPDEVSYTWSMFLEGEDLERENWPLVRWLIEQHFLPKLRENIALDAIYKGVYAAPLAGTAGPPASSMDGYEKAMDDFVTAGQTTPIAMGAVPTSPTDFVTYVETFLDSIDERYNNRVATVQMSEELARRYSRGYQEKYGTGVVLPGQMVESRIANYQARVEGLASMQGKNRIWATLPGNALLVAKKWNNSNQVAVDKADNPREVNIWTDFYVAPSFAVPRLVFLSDQV